MILKNYMTKRTFESLKKHLHYLTTQKAKEIKIMLREAKSGGGGMHDNAGYDNALMQERMLMHQITELKEKLQATSIIEDLEVKTEIVSLGTQVTIEILNTGEEKTYIILGPDDTDVSKGYISHLSPIGKALIGKRIDDEVEINLPRGQMVARVLQITRPKQL